MKNRMLLSFLILVLGLCSVHAQRIGINTTDPGDAALTIRPNSGKALLFRDGNDNDAFIIRADGNSWVLADATGNNILTSVVGADAYTEVKTDFEVSGDVSFGSNFQAADTRLTITPPNGLGKAMVFRDFMDNTAFEIRTDGNSWVLANETGNNIFYTVKGADAYTVVTTDFEVIGGDLEVSGAKNFVIDHPLEPATKSLRHACVEGPEAYNVYSGTITLDGQGKASVILPDYFEALNKDYRYQLTAIGAAAPSLHVAKEVTGNQFVIAGGTPGMKVSWEVTGVRNDPYFQDHPYQAVQPKSANDQGRYYYPKGYGQPESMSIGAAPQKTDQ
ncbi:MAG: hypothetical protein R2787_11725 [Saprospiraceae bacterium]